jgi:hypothetical protein
MKLDTLPAATVPVLVMLLPVELAAGVVPAFEVVEAWVAWVCHQLVDPLMLPIDMAAVSNDLAMMVHSACHRGTTLFGAIQVLSRAVGRSDVPSWAGFARQLWQAFQA